MVAPFMVTKEHVLGNVSGVFNGILVKGNMLGDVMLYGKGAGKLPTASAVVSDVIDAAKNIGRNKTINWEQDKVAVSDVLDYKCRFFARVKANKAAVENAFGNVTYVSLPDITDETAFVSEVMSERDFADKADKLELIYRIRTTM